MIKVIVNGAKGKMGAESVKAINKETDMSVVKECDLNDDLLTALQESLPQVVVDFTHPSCVKDNALTILSHGSCPIIGTTGLSGSDLQDIHSLAEEKDLGALVIPNFAIGAVLMMTMAQEAAKHMDRVEIIEYHHDKKADSPSGTAIKTAEMIHIANPTINASPLDETELIKGSRGGSKHNIPIHAIRTPGFVANQDIIFGGLGQTLTISHKTISRESFMPGVVLSVRKIQELKGLVYGLENIL